MPKSRPGSPRAGDPAPRLRPQRGSRLSSPRQLRRRAEPGTIPRHCAGWVGFGAAYEGRRGRRRDQRRATRMDDGAGQSFSVGEVLWFLVDRRTVEVDEGTGTLALDTSKAGFAGAELDG